MNAHTCWIKIWIRKILKTQNNLKQVLLDGKLILSLSLCFFLRMMCMLLRTGSYVRVYQRTLINCVSTIQSHIVCTWYMYVTPFSCTSFQLKATFFHLWVIIRIQVNTDLKKNWFFVQLNKNNNWSLVNVGLILKKNIYIIQYYLAGICCINCKAANIQKVLKVPLNG